MNEPYIYSAIRSVVFDLHRANKRVKKIEINSEILSIQDEEYNEEMPISYIEVEHKLKDIHFFHREVFRVYTTEVQSIRKLAKKIDISEKTIFNSIKICKKKLRSQQA